MIEVKPEVKAQNASTATPKPAALPRSFCVVSKLQSPNRIMNLTFWAKPCMPSFTSTLVNSLNGGAGTLWLSCRKMKVTSAPGWSFFSSPHQEDQANGTSWSRYQLDAHITRSRETFSEVVSFNPTLNYTRGGFRCFQSATNHQDNCEACTPQYISNLSQDTPALSEALKLWQPNKKAASMINRWRSQRQCLAGAIIHDARRISTESISQTTYEDPSYKRTHPTAIRLHTLWFRML